ncbi:2-oxoglutarate dehydrogenase, E2 component, dihydrolipoamide succinyltransferase [Dactylosporangium sp. AC04546]|uniref:2-oxoglutarate dehydrogenase, E2 component, dihydrolipoamide succinyltransferase n=1 Tax=Dactylosporangium sp. AC04546 TaxID=2862460 RepID=UPI002E7B6851|nr:2-oxoglutarate dehydrogenase, E2 component, dihydrolipoamide succinyltransferase [Dactylosporangium sp. AC04546]WVK82246.1 2-oxoglutarate dehydrogenase, E2 component, dihydrolipoamide succinyltransferase [Dactylosporangium sp. AC04546]
MPVSVTMPRLGESVTEGTVTRWLKQEGDLVEADEPLLEVSTDKVDTEIPSPAAGVLTRIVVQEDETAEVGAELAVIGDGAEGGSGGAAAPAEAAEVSQEPEPEPEAPAAAEPEPQAAAAPPAAAPPSGEGTAVKMPALGESVTEGTVTRWLKQVGDQVEADEPLLEVSTDKVDTEIPSPVAGTLLEIKVQEDETVEVGAELALIGVAGAAPAAAPAPAKAEPKPEAKAEPKVEPKQQPAAAPQPVAEAQPAATAPVETGPATNVTAGGNGKVEGDEAGYVTPLVRKLAAEHGVSLAGLAGTGVGGRIRKQDVLDAAAKAKEAAKAAAAPAPAAAPAAAAPKAAAPKAAPSPLRGQTQKLTRMRALIARRMVESLQISAQLTTVVEVDVTRVAKLRAQAKDQFLATHGVKLSFLPFFALAAVEALRVHPSVNSSIDLEAGTVTYHDAEHLGMAVDTEKGLIVPVIKHAGDLNLGGLAKRIADVADRTRNNKLNPDDITGGTFTLTNTGSRGALFDTPIINQPQVAILGTGAVVKRAVVVNDPDLGEIIAPRSMVYLALSYDHRIVDGADAARFLTTVKERLEAGNFEADLGL